MKDARFWIDRLGMVEHVEGGYYVETYRSAERISGAHLPARYGGSARATATAIHFLVEGSDFSAFHRLRSDEIWQWCAGTTLAIHLIESRAGYGRLLLGPDPDPGETFQAVVPGGTWVAARPVDPGSYALVSCIVAPGFELSDMEVASRAALIAEFPGHGKLIETLTR